MFPEYRLLNEKLTAFKRIVENKKCVIIITKVVSDSESMVRQFAECPLVDAHCVGHFVQSLE